MQKLLFLILVLLGCQVLDAQDYPHQIELLQAELAKLKAAQTAVELKIEDVKLVRIRQELKDIGLPTTDYIEHLAMMLAYSETHEQARWVAHIITPDIIDGTLSRSNDFRADPLVTTGTAVQTDYFLTDTLANGKVEYDGFGYDRGHLAPSADFRWSARAMSESYYYSNMSPQVADFNRESWADLEAHLRGYVYKHPETQLYVFTGPVLDEELPVIPRSPNGLRIPKTYFKVALDLQAGQAIGFLMPNAKASYPLEHYAVPVDRVEALTGLDFFSKLPNAEAIESKLEKAHWFEAIAQGDVEPLYPPSLPRNHFNTIQARDHINSGRAVTICGKVVSARYSRSGNVWLNLDKRYPNDICSVMIRKEDLVNFSGDPIELFEGKVVAAKGKVFALGGKPVVGVKRGEDLWEMGGGV